MVQSVNGAIQQGPINSVERTISETIVEPGSTTAVTVTAEFSEEVAPSIVEQIDPPASNMSFTEIVPNTDLTAIRETDEFVVIHENESEITVTYEVTVPNDAAEGAIFRLEGHLETAETELLIPGNTTIAVSETEGPPALPDHSSPPQDLDGDGRYEDINGDGEFTIRDVQAFLEQRNTAIVQDNPEFFNFANESPADVTLNDVQALFQLLEEQK